jgi:hypothetical protein
MITGPPPQFHGTRDILRTGWRRGRSKQAHAEVVQTVRCPITLPCHAVRLRSRGVTTLELQALDR